MGDNNKKKNHNTRKSFADKMSDNAANILTQIK